MPFASLPRASNMKRNPRNDISFNPWRRAASGKFTAIVEAACVDAEGKRLELARANGRSPRGLQARYKETFRTTVEALLADTAAHHLLRRADRIFLSLDTSLLGRADVAKAPALNSTLPDRLDELDLSGWLDVDKGGRSPRRGAHRTTILAGPKLIAAITEASVGIEDLGHTQPKDVLVVRDDSHDVSITETPKYKAMTRQLVEINEWLTEAKISPTGDFDGSRDLNDRCVRRTFMRGRLDRGGRMAGGFWFQMPKHDRLRQITLSGERPVELDYSGAVPRIAYGLTGARPPKPDVYDIPGLETVSREGRKEVVNALFWDDGKRDRLPQGTKRFFGRINGRQAVEFIHREHGVIRNYLGTYAGPELQFYESEIITAVTHSLLGLGIVALPVHDAVIVPRSRADEAKGVMIDVFDQVCGGEAVVRRLDLVEV